MHRTPARILATLMLVSLAAVPPAFARRAVAPRPAPAASIVFAPMFVPTPIPALLPEEELAISRSSLDLVPFRLASGALGLDLQGRFQEFAVASTDANGKLTLHCVDNADALRRLLAAPAKAAPVAPLEDR